MLALILDPRPVHADCAAGPYYTQTAMGNTVAVCERAEVTCPVFFGPDET
jgi:hypothetical protein